MIEYMFLEEDGETQYWLGGTILRGMGSKKSAKDWWTVAFEDDSNLGVSSSRFAMSSAYVANGLAWADQVKCAESERGSVWRIAA